MAPTVYKHDTYTNDQISTYFRHISLPADSQDLCFTPSKLHRPSNALEFLIRLQQYHLCTVPFENLALHYSQHHTISINPDHLYHKIVQKARGGYCMENNCFFGTVLRSLGFTVYSAGARVSRAADGMSGEKYNGWSHMVNIVALSDGKKYMLDVGFGANGPIRPLLLDGNGNLKENIKPAEARLVHENIPENSDPNQRLWIYQHRYDPQSEWMPMYCFTELEFLPQDYELMNFWTSQSRKSWFTQQVVAVRMIVEDGDILGTVMLTGGEAKKRIRGKTEPLKTCAKEEERVEVLKKWFGVELTDEDMAGIKGMVSELK